MLGERDDQAIDGGRGPGAGAVPHQPADWPVCPPPAMVAQANVSTTSILVSAKTLCLMDLEFKAAVLQNILKKS